jgi:hypothetical protein
MAGDSKMLKARVRRTPAGPCSGRKTMENLLYFPEQLAQTLQ